MVKASPSARRMLMLALSGVRLSPFGPLKRKSVEFSEYAVDKLVAEHAHFGWCLLQSSRMQVLRLW